MLVNKYSVSVLVSTKPTIHLEKDSAATGKKMPEQCLKLKAKNNSFFEYYERNCEFRSESN